MHPHSRTLGLQLGSRDLGSPVLLCACCAFELRALAWLGRRLLTLDLGLGPWATQQGSDAAGADAGSVSS